MGTRYPVQLKAGPAVTQIQALYDGASQDLSATVTAAHTAAFGDDVGIVRIVAISDPIRYATGVDATATATSTYLPAGLPEYIAIPPGGRVSVLAYAGTTPVNITAMMADEA